MPQHRLAIATIGSRWTPGVAAAPATVVWIKMLAASVGRGHAPAEGTLALWSAVAFAGLLAWWSVACVGSSEREARESAERLRQMADHVSDAFFVVDAETEQPLYVNPAWSAIWGCTDDRQYDPDAWINAVHPDDRARWRAGRDRVKHGAETNEMFQILRPDGTTRWIQERACPVRDDTGVVYRFVGIATDITAVRAVEEQLKHAQKMEAVGRLAGGIAHDFNNLLTVIIAEAELLSADLERGTEQAGAAVAIADAGHSAVALTRQLLAFSRRQLSKPATFPLESAVAETGTMLRRLIGEDIRLEIRRESHGACVRADKGQIDQVLSNLAVNARDAMPHGGALTIETKTITVDDAYASACPDVPKGDYVVLSVSDTGDGMTPEVRARIFEPFFTTKAHGKGTGLGLATCQSIVEQAGGHITVESSVGFGTVIRVFLPRAEAGAVANTMAPAIDDVPRGSETILLVEDENNVRRVAMRTLQGLGYAVLTAQNACEADKLLAAYPAPVHLLLSDVVLPNVGGPELSERARRRRPGIQVLFMTGHTDESVDHEDCLSQGARVLQKPYTRAALATRVREALDRAS